MADIEHANIPDAFLHEPKGVFSATSGQVYEANGAGSGSWVTPTVDFENMVEVTSLDDLPAPVSNQIIGETGKTYYISGKVDISPNQFVISNPDVSLRGFNRSAPDTLISNTSGAVVVSTGQFAVFKGVALKNTGGGKLFDLTGTGAEVALLDEMIFDDCFDIGTISGFANVIIDSTALFGTATSSGITFSGTNGELVVRDCVCSNWNNAMFQLGTATFTRINFSRVRWAGDAADVAIDGLPGSGNLVGGGTGIISDCFFSGMTNPTGANIDHGDSNWFFGSSPGVQASGFVGFLAMTGNTATTSLTQDVWTKVAGVTTASPSNERFSMTADNELTSNVLLPTPVSINLSISATKTGGGSDTVQFTVFKDSGGGFVQLVPSVVSTINAVADIDSTSITMVDTATPGDKYSVYTKNTTSGAAVEVNDLQFNMRG